MRIVPPIIVQMLVTARCAIFYSCSAADCAASNAKATTSKVAAPLKSTCSWQFIDGGDFFSIAQTETKYNALSSEGFFATWLTSSVTRDAVD